MRIGAQPSNSHLRRERQILLYRLAMEDRQPEPEPTPEPTLPANVTPIDAARIRRQHAAAAVDRGIDELEHA